MDFYFVNRFVLGIDRWILCGCGGIGREIDKKLGIEEIYEDFCRDFVIS